MPNLTKIKHKATLFWRIPYKFKAMFIINFFLLGLARAAVLSLSFRRLKPCFGQFYKMTSLSTILSNKQQFRAIQIGKWIRITAKYTPWDSNCLAQALVAKTWCRLYKIPHVLYIGFAKSGEKPVGFEGHAWVTAGRFAITGGQGHLKYTVVSTYVYFAPPHAIKHMPAKGLSNHV